MRDRNKPNLNIDDFREVFLKYTQKAFQMLPKLDNPQILDIGCGTGIPTIELAKLTDGFITAMDINSKDLRKLEKKIEEQGFENRIKIIEGSLLNYNFKPLSFDIIWAEGVIHIIGFKRGFKVCHKILKKGGFLVLNEAIKGIKDYIDQLSSFGFTLYDWFKLPDNAWWDEFYKLLESRIKKLSEMNLNKNLRNKMSRYKRDIEMVKSNPKNFNTAFYILQKS
jgi:ubiquinone/menaquinone biosynthesis C-methylase UbiE